jgi:hypothetical protein
MLCYVCVVRVDVGIVLLSCVLFYIARAEFGVVLLPCCLVDSCLCNTYRCRCDNLYCCINFG